jgi:hypothetical protein
MIHADSEVAIGAVSEISAMVVSMVSFTKGGELSW